MTEDIHKIDRPAFDPIRVRPNQENSGNLQKRRDQGGKPRADSAPPDLQSLEADHPGMDEGNSRLLDIQV